MLSVNPELCTLNEKRRKNRKKSLTFAMAYVSEMEVAWKCHLCQWTLSHYATHIYLAVTSMHFEISNSRLIKMKTIRLEKRKISLSLPINLHWICVLLWSRSMRAGCLVLSSHTATWLFFLRLCNGILCMRFFVVVFNFI